MPIDESQLTPTQRLIYDTLNGTQKQIYLDLSDEVRDIVGRWAPPNGCLDDQKLARVCEPDPRVTAQVGVRKPTDWDLIPAGDQFNGRVAPWRIKGARKGNLLLTPGGPSGVIGALLSALTPPQDYSHMGIVIADDGDNGTVLRHCTASEDWLMRKVFTTGTIFDDTPLEMAIPLHGFRSDAVHFLWPGTITQTVEIAFKSHYDVNYATRSTSSTRTATICGRRTSSGWTSASCARSIPSSTLFVLAMTAARAAGIALPR